MTRLEGAGRVGAPRSSARGTRPRPGRAATVVLALWSVLIAAPTIGRAQRYRFPLTCDGCAYVSAYVDHDPSGGLEDWACRAHTYGGHDGTDFDKRR